MHFNACPDCTHGIVFKGVWAGKGDDLQLGSKCYGQECLPTYAYAESESGGK